MTHKEFSSKGGQASKGTAKAKERAQKGAAARWKDHIPLDERSKKVATLKARGKIKEAKGIHTADTLFQPDEYSQQHPDYTSDL